MERIGFVGLGHMGLPMAINLINAGHSVTGFDLNPQPLKLLKNSGGLIAQNLQEIATDHSVIITMLQTGSQVCEVYLAENGLFDNAAKGSLFIDCSTIDVQSTQALSQEAENHSFFIVDAPVSGGMTGATAATLTFMVGGKAKAVERAQPILARMGKKIIPTGPSGSGQAAKICNNMILGISMIAVAEAFVLARHLGLSAESLFEVVKNSSGQCWAMSNYCPVPNILPNVPANNEYQPGFTCAMMLKDLNLSQNSAATVGIETPMGACARSLYAHFDEQGNGELDFSAIIKTLGAQ